MISCVHRGLYIDALKKFYNLYNKLKIYVTHNSLTYHYIIAKLLYSHSYLSVPRDMSSPKMLLS